MSKNSSLTIYQPMKYRLIYFLISLSVILPGVYSLWRYGLRLSIDFTGGSILLLSGDNLSQKKITDTLQSAGVRLLDLNQTDSTWRLTTPPIKQEKYEEIVNQLNSTAGPVSVKEFSTVGAILGQELIQKTLYGILLASGLILIYIAFRFQNFKFGITAILAMLHDTLVLLGTFSLLGHFFSLEIDSLFVTAVLTILSFSVHDTIVVYDRIRELVKLYPHLAFEEVVNRAVVETLGRSINNSMTIIFMLLAMYLMGGRTIHNFILALLIGTISGTYSSTFTAAPLLVVWNNLAEKRKTA